MTENATPTLFDVDGTLVDSNYLHALTWWQAFAQAGHDVPIAEIYRAIGMCSDQLLDTPHGHDPGDSCGLHWVPLAQMKLLMVMVLAFVMPLEMIADLTTFLSRMSASPPG